MPSGWLRTPALTIARLTLREAARRRLLLALAIFTLLVIGLTGWGFQRLTTITNRGQPLTATEIRLITSQLLILVMFTFSFVLALSSAFVAAPALANEVESGVALALLSRPISRTEVILGKWLGLVAVATFYIVGAAVLELTIVNLVTGYAPPRPVEMVAYLIGETTVLLTLGLLLSTRVPAMTGGIVAAAAFGLAWMAGIAGGIGLALENTALSNVGTISRLLLPTDGLWRGAIYSAEPAAVIAAVVGAARTTSAGAASNPFFASTPPPAPYLAWVSAWIVLTLGLAVLSFRHREL